MNSLLDYGLRILVSSLCGLLLGLERRSKQHPVGIRTLVLISISSTLLSILSINMADAGIGHGDPTRIAAGVVTGIGFIGGGAILRQGFNIRGITTAAIIFSASAIGLACGAELYIPTAITLLISIFVLYALNKVERKLFPAAKNKQLTLTFQGNIPSEEIIITILKKYGLIIHDLNMEYSVDNNQSKLIYTIKTPDSLDTANLASELKNINNLVSFTLADR